jgi:hypothetical protein
MAGGVAESGAAEMVAVVGGVAETAEDGAEVDEAAAGLEEAEEAGSAVAEAGGGEMLAMAWHGSVKGLCMCDFAGLWSLPYQARRPVCGMAWHSMALAFRCVECLYLAMEVVMRYPFSFLLIRLLDSSYSRYLTIRTDRHPSSFILIMTSNSAIYLVYPPCPIPILIPFLRHWTTHMPLSNLVSLVSPKAQPITTRPPSDPPRSWYPGDSGEFPAS